MKNYRSVEVNILGKNYRYKVNEPEEVISKILEEIKSEVEDYSRKIGSEKIDYILLLMLLNEKLNTIKTRQEIKDLIAKFSKSLNTTLNPIIDPPENKEEDKSVSWDEKWRLGFLIQVLVD